jgi:5'-3' exonuclease
LIQKYQTIDAIYTHIDEISGDVKQKLLDGKQDVAQSRQLIELKHIPEIQSTTLDTFALKLDFATYKDVLVHTHHFTSFDKTLDELKKQLQMPIQN